MAETLTLGSRWRRKEPNHVEVEIVWTGDSGDGPRVGYRMVDRNGLGRLCYSDAESFQNRYAPIPNPTETTTMKLGEFHTRDGLTFRRNDDGTVTVTKYTDATCATVLFQQALSDHEWESVSKETEWGAMHKRPADWHTPTAPSEGGETNDHG